nr:ATP synthase F0 subunit 8 [Drilaster sp. 2 XYG-2023a]
MPQMSPLNWLNLMMMFVSTFMIFNSLNYFSFLYKTSINNIKQEKKIKKWKW